MAFPIQWNALSLCVEPCKEWLTCPNSEQCQYYRIWDHKGNFEQHLKKCNRNLGTTWSTDECVCYFLKSKDPPEGALGEAYKQGEYSSPPPRPAPAGGAVLPNGGDEELQFLMKTPLETVQRLHAFPPGVPLTARYAHFWFSPELPQLGSVVKRRSHNEETIDIWDGKEVLRHTLKQGLHVLVPRAADQLTRLRELLLKDDDLSVVGLALDLLPIRQQDVDTFAVMKGGGKAIAALLDDEPKNSKDGKRKAFKGKDVKIADVSTVPAFARELPVPRGKRATGDRARPSVMIVKEVPWPSEPPHDAFFCTSMQCHGRLVGGGRCEAKLHILEERDRYCPEHDFQLGLIRYRQEHVYPHTAAGQLEHNHKWESNSAYLPERQLYFPPDLVAGCPGCDAAGRDPNLLVELFPPHYDFDVRSALARAVVLLNTLPPRAASAMVACLANGKFPRVLHTRWVHIDMTETGEKNEVDMFDSSEMLELVLLTEVIEYWRKKYGVWQETRKRKERSK